MKLVIAFVKPFKLDEVRDELKAVGTTGMSVSEVRGFGRQSGQTEVYRGAEYTVDFVPKIRIEVIASDEITPAIVRAVTEAGHTGEIGDGKIFVYDLNEAVRIRTGDRGKEAI